MKSPGKHVRTWTLLFLSVFLFLNVSGQSVGIQVLPEKSVEASPSTEGSERQPAVLTESSKATNAQVAPLPKVVTAEGVIQYGDAATFARQGSYVVTISVEGLDPAKCISAEQTAADRGFLALTIDPVKGIVSAAGTPVTLSERALKLWVGEALMAPSAAPTK